MQTSTNKHNINQQNFKSIGQPFSGENLIWQREDEKKVNFNSGHFFLPAAPKGSKGTSLYQCLL